MITSKRVERVAMELKRTLSRIIICELKDPRLGFITITKVEAEPDLKTAKVFLSVLAEPVKQNKVLSRIKHARGYIQYLLGKEMELRTMPILSFYLDNSVAEDIKPDKLIDGC